MVLTGVSISRTKSLIRKAAWLVAAAQLFVGAAPLLEWSGRNANSHIEAQGVQLHHAHDEANCVVCVSHRLLSGAELARPNFIGSVRKARGELRELSTRAVFSPRHLRNSRAPPASVSYNG
jgi:hypothetical protein